MKLVRKLLLVVPLLYLVTLSGLTLGGEFDETDFIHEVAHPRACILIDSEGNTKGAAENFAHGHGEGDQHEMNLFVKKGTTVYFKSGFGYEGVWYKDAMGTLSTKIVVYLDEALVDAEEHKNTATGPGIESGSVSIPIIFDVIGDFTVKSDLATTVKASDESIIAEDIDTVTTYVHVGEEPEIILVNPENEAILSPAIPPTFEWLGYGFKKFQLQLSTSADFLSENTLTLPRLRETRRTSITLKERLWKRLGKKEEETGVIYWRVLGTVDGREGKSETWQFSIE